MDQTLSYYASILYKSFLSFTAGQLQTLGLSCGQLPFILFVGKHPDCSPAQLTAAMHMDWGHSQRSLTRLVQDGFISKTQSETDRRMSILRLTASGEEAFRLSHQVFYSWDEDKLNALEPGEQEQLLALLSKVALSAARDLKPHHKETL